MFFRTESLLAGAVGAPAAQIVNAAATALATAAAGLFGRRRRRSPEVLTLSEHELRDVGLDRHVACQPIPYDLLDLMPGGLTFGQRHRR